MSRQTGGRGGSVYAFVWGLVHVAVSPGVLNSVDRPSLLIHDRQQVHSKVGNKVGNFAKVNIFPLTNGGAQRASNR